MASAGPRAAWESPSLSVQSGKCSRVWTIANKALAYHGPGVDSRFSQALEAVSQGGHGVSSRCVCWAEPWSGIGWAGMGRLRSLDFWL